MANIRKFAIPVKDYSWHPWPRNRGGYSGASYQFTNVKPTSRTMATIAVIAGYNAVNYFPTRREIAAALGEPDPSAKPYSFGNCWGSSRYAALQEAGFILKERDGKTFRYTVTQRGYQALEAVTGIHAK